MKIKFLVFILLFLPFLTPNAHATTYEITDLGAVYTNDGFRNLDINNAGQVVGTQKNGSSNIAFLWDSTNGKQILGNPYPNYMSNAYGINDNGFVVGSINSPNGVRASSWLNANAVAVPVGQENTLSSQAYAVNQLGQMVGYTLLASIGQPQAVLWNSSNSSGQLLGNIGGTNSWAYDINNHGQVAGTAYTLPGSSLVAPNAFIWDSQNGMQDLGTLSTNKTYASYAFGMNELGQVVGVSQTDDSRGIFHAFLWDSVNGMQDLGSFQGFDIPGSITTAFDINDFGQIVGTTGGGYGEKALLWENGQTYDLNSLIDPSNSWILQRAVAINESGQIVGSGDFNGSTHGYLLTPVNSAVPEPSTILLLSLGGLMTLSRYRRKKTQL